MCVCVQVSMYECVYACLCVRACVCSLSYDRETSQYVIMLKISKIMNTPVLVCFLAS